MVDRGIFDGNLAIFQRYEFDHLDDNNIVVIERIGDEQGFGAWALKKFVIKAPRSAHQNELDDRIYWNDNDIVLYSYNRAISLHQLDPDGEYRVHGLYRRRLPADEVTLVDSDVIRHLACGKK